MALKAKHKYLVVNIFLAKRLRVIKIFLYLCFQNVNKFIF